MTEQAIAADRRKLERMRTPDLLAAARDREQQREMAEMAANEAALRRNAAILTLSRRGVRNAEIAEVLGRSPARIGQILARAAAEELAEQEQAAVA